MCQGEKQIGKTSCTCHFSRCLEHNMATSDEESHCKLPLGFPGEIVAMVLYTSLIIVGSSGNMFVILAINRTPTLRNVCGILIANMAVADLMVTAIVMPVIVYVLIQGFLDECTYHTPLFVSWIIALFSAGSSLKTLTTLSVDRCFAICRPIKHKTIVTVTKAKIVIAMTWVGSLILPLLETFYPGSTPSKFFQTIGVVCYYSIMVMSGIFTIRHVRANSRQIGSLHQGQGTSRLAADLNQRNKQVAKTIGLVVFVFTLCWIPLAYLIGIEINKDRNNRLYFWFASLGLANSAVNPWIYFYRQPNYRKALKSLLGCKRGTPNVVVQVQNRTTTQGTKVNT
ncbi:beta-1 adrenergic receptor-like [Stylophora pistillata]|uniref:beta-1 adrenergic receptor-like n=1 Tax=Stylophora pistillata TaxID=50429 RepID=UPI000C042D46|nr:beta-1 adrenergic receptor-like [Stylophora pistillata]